MRIRFLARHACLALISLLLVGCSPTPCAPTDVTYSITPVFTYPVMGGEVELGVRFTLGAEPVTPQAYMVTADQVMVLDTALSQIIIFRDSVPMQVISIPDIWDGRSLTASTEDTIYVWDQFQQMVHRITVADETIEGYSFSRYNIECIPRLKPNRYGQTVLAIGYDEYSLDQSKSPGLTFPGVPGRHTISHVGTSQVDVMIDGRKRWSLQADDLKDVRLLGYDAERRLVAMGVDLGVNPPALCLFLLSRNGKVSRGILDLPALEAVPEHAFSVGSDGRIYLFGFTRTDMLIFTIEVRGEKDS